MISLKRAGLCAVFCAMVLMIPQIQFAQAAPVGQWQKLWPETDFSKTTVSLDEIQSGGPGKDGIPAIDNPQFTKVAQAKNISDEEPVIGLIIDGDARAYPLRVLMWHEIVNDTVGGVPVAVTYCPLCNTSITFDRRLDNQVLDFGTTGNLRHSDLVMYDRQTESWWQQFSGEAIVGELVGSRLRMIPSRLESFENFRLRAPEGKVLIPNNPNARDYGANPYVGYDRSPLPFLYKGVTPKGVPPMLRVVAIEDTAFALPLLQSKSVVEHAGLRITWKAGQKSALDTGRIDRGADVGNIVVTRNGQDVPYVVTFAFAFFAFHPDGSLYQSEKDLRQNGAAG